MVSVPRTEAVVIYSGRHMPVAFRLNDFNKQTELQPSPYHTISSTFFHISHLNGNPSDSFRMTAPIIEDDANLRPCHLLDLCCELRDMIYNFALIEARPIQFKNNNTEQPGLLRVNKEIRAGATPIYYRENIFNIDCDGYVPTGIQAFQRQSKRWLSMAMINKKKNLLSRLPVQASEVGEYLVVGERGVRWYGYGGLGC